MAVIFPLYAVSVKYLLKTEENRPVKPSDKSDGVFS
jgi:hypothetical protein